MKIIRNIIQQHKALWVILGVVLIISLLFPFMFVFIDRGSVSANLLREFWLTPLRMLTITIMVYWVIQVGNKLLPAYPNHWLRHMAQLVIIFPLMYWLLYGIYIWVDLPLSCPECKPDTHSWSYRRYIGLYVVGTIFFYGFVSGLNFYELSKVKLKEAEQLQKVYAQARLQALQSQVNPHFLFNSLSVLSELVQKDPELSERFIFRLIISYRYILEQKDTKLATVKDELEFLDAYFFLLQIRFGNKIKLDKNVDPSCLGCLLPAHTLQLLVENVVKHNRMSEKEPLTIFLKVNNDCLQVSNPKRTREQKQISTGIGLENIKTRLAHVTERPVQILTNNERFSVKIPLLQNTIKMK